MDVLQQLNAVLEGRYEIEREIGAGGMATVYLGHDVRHHRSVAVKVLRPELGAVLGPDRFLGEIRLTANLQHPHLLPLFDSGEADGLLFYVMPFVEGETLRQRLDRERQLPVDDAVRIAVAVAGALDYAHRHNIVHRDLKPENILLHDGQPLVSDFGIALAVSNAGGGRITQTGLSLGTPHYMSPEQATGDRQIDARSDIYSLGAVLYEMLLGAPPHTGNTVQAVIAKVLTDRPHAMRAIRETIPEYVEAATLCALSKLPADRFATAAEFAAALTGMRTTSMPSFAATQVPSATSSAQVKKYAPWAAAVAVVALASFWVMASSPTPRGYPSMFEVTFVDSVQPLGAGAISLALNRAGSQLAFVGQHGGNQQGVYVRPLDALQARLVKGTENGVGPIFSPDGDWLLFNASGLKKVPTVGGAPIKLTDSMGVATWTDHHEIVIARGTDLYIISDEGGDVRLLAHPDTQRAHTRYSLPFALPGGKNALITIFKGSPTAAGGLLGLVNLRTGKITELGIPGVSPRYVATGHVIFARVDGSVLAVPFSLRRLKVTGPGRTSHRTSSGETQRRRRIHDLGNWPT